MDLGIDYIVTKRAPYPGLPSPPPPAPSSACPTASTSAAAGSTKSLRLRPPPPEAVTLSIEPTIAFNERSGMATSTRNKALDLWGSCLPPGDPGKIPPTSSSATTTRPAPKSSPVPRIIGPAHAPASTTPTTKAPTGPPASNLPRRSHPPLRRRSPHPHPLGPRGPEYDVLSDTHIDHDHAAALPQPPKPLGQFSSPRPAPPSAPSEAQISYVPT